MKVRVKTRVQGYNGESLGLRFVNGYAEGDINESQLDYFKTSGYLVTLLEMPQLKVAEKPKSSQTKASPKPRGKRSKKC